MSTTTYIYSPALVARGDHADVGARRTYTPTPTGSPEHSPTDFPTDSLTQFITKPTRTTESFWAPSRPSTASSAAVPSSSPTMSDTGAAAGSAASTDGIDTWKLVLGVLLPLLCIALGVCVFLCYRQRKHRIKKADVEQVGTMLQDLKSSQAEVDAMKGELQNGLERVKEMEAIASKRDSLWSRDGANAELNAAQPSLHFPPALRGMMRSGSPNDPITPTPIGFRSFSPVEPRPLSGNTLQGTLPRAALGLQHTQYSRGRAASHQSVESGETSVSYKPPSTIPEESTGLDASPFDTPGKKSTDQIAVVVHEESPSERGERSLTRRVSRKAKALIRRNSVLSLRPDLSPMRANPSHPDLVPQPLAVTKRNSVRETSAEANSLSSRYGIDKTRLRRSASNPPVNRSYLSDSESATPTILADRTTSATPVEESTGKSSYDDSFPSPFELRKYTNTSTTGQRRQTAPRAQNPPSGVHTHVPQPAKTRGPFGCIPTPPSTAETLSALQERRDGGNSKSIRPDKYNKSKKNKKQSQLSNTTLHVSGDGSKSKENIATVTRNTPTPPPSGPPPAGSPPKRPLPVLPSRIPISASHRCSLGAGHKIGSKPQLPVASGAMGARKRSSLSSMRFSPSPSKRRSQFLLGVSSLSSPIRGGRAGILSSSANPSTPGQQRLPPSYASSQCLPSVDTMESLASASSSSASADNSYCAGSKDSKSSVVPHEQQSKLVTQEEKNINMQQQQTFATPYNSTNTRGRPNGNRGHARLLSELSATLRLVHEEEDAVAEQATASASSTRTAAGVSS
ncbi:uncharacterized protein PG986_008242 [Apiospora aurea]|uniref:Uncharacterized protein n=1 Tax=Apiospora aurea TaxID=335848 RepID=A0ABR1QF36_9PEZI